MEFGERTKFLGHLTPTLPLPFTPSRACHCTGMKVIFDEEYEMKYNGLPYSGAVLMTIVFGLRTERATMALHMPCLF